MTKKQNIGFGSRSKKDFLDEVRFITNPDFLTTTTEILELKEKKSFGQFQNTPHRKEFTQLLDTYFAGGGNIFEIGVLVGWHDKEKHDVYFIVERGMLQLLADTHKKKAIELTDEQRAGYMDFESEGSSGMRYDKGVETYDEIPLDEK